MASATPPPLPPLIERLFLFPLPDAQLFPHALLPLHVFEPRYRALTHDCLAASGLLAVPALRPGFEDDYQGRPPVRPICGVGHIVQSHRYPDGRYDMLVRGLGRARIVEELPPTQPYRVARAVRLDDILRPDPELETSRRALLALCDRLAALLPSGAETLRALARQEDDPSATADLIASALVVEPGERQAALEQLDVGVRLDQLAALVARLVGKFGAAGTTGSRN
jgi:Lon protease-like protein